MASAEHFNEYIETVAKKLVPDVKIRYKNTSWLMKLIAVLVYPINRYFMTEYTTVLGTTVYFPSREWLQARYTRAISIMSHELVHLVDRSSEKKLMFEIKYMFPQILGLFSIFAVLAFISPWFLLFLGFLVCLAPWKAVYRLRYEATAYCMSMHYQEIIKDSFDFTYWVNVYASELSGSSYYYPTRKREVAAREISNRYDWCAKNHPACIASIMWLEAQRAKGYI